VRQNYEATLTKTAGGEADIFLTIQSGEVDAVYLAPVRLTSVAVTPGAAGGPTGHLEWTAQESYYSGFRILHSPDLDGWTQIGAGNGPDRAWNGPVPEGPLGFLRVEGSLTAVE
jgi:hypothetical protein